MRDKNFHSQSFFLELERLAKRVCSDKFLTRSALANSNPRRKVFQNEFVITDKSRVNLMNLSILSWFMNEEDRILIQDALRDTIQEDLVVLEILLESKGSCFIWLSENSKYHTRDFFGNVFTKKKLERAFSTIRPIWLYTNRPVKEIVRRRGYKDKGTWRPPSKPHVIPPDVITEEELWEKESTFTDTVQFIRGFIGTG